jgi:hypothetical protein
MKHTSTVSLTDSIAVYFFDGAEDFCAHTIYVGFFFGCRVINPRISALQQLVLIGELSGAWACVILFADRWVRL